MLQITSITSEPKQKHKLPVEGFEDCEMTLEWKDTQAGWFVTLVWGDWRVDNMRLCSLPNILMQWSNILPFGILVLTKSKQDPMTVDAFEQEEAALYVYSESERDEVGALYG
jgi:hypothetical protein